MFCLVFVFYFIFNLERVEVRALRLLVVIGFVKVRGIQMIKV
jgi:hypothetical protein